MKGTRRRTCEAEYHQHNGDEGEAQAKQMGVGHDLSCAWAFLLCVMQKLLAGPVSSASGQMLFSSSNPGLVAGLVTDTDTATVAHLVAGEMAARDMSP
jgi:hypothetical protein